MVDRLITTELTQLLRIFPAVGLLGPRQVGKTTLALSLAKAVGGASVYLDLEKPSDIMKLSDPEAYLALHADKLIILDEIHRMPEFFRVLRGEIDLRRRRGQRSGQFLILGSASLDLLQQSSETLAGRIAYKELTGFSLLEVGNEQERLWLRGGFPDSYGADSDEDSFLWRLNLITTYLERDIPSLGPRIPAVTLRRLWTMLAHSQGGQLNMAQLASALALSAPTVKKYIELLEDLLLVRSLRPWSKNVGKRMVKSPKIYIRDSGLTHALLNLATLEDVLSHPIAGASWEGMVVEQLLSVLPSGITSWYYRTSAGAEIDLIIEKNDRTIYAIEIKRSLSPSVSKGFILGCTDVGASHRFVVYPGQEQYPLPSGIMAIPLVQMIQMVKAI
jgi:predicted AAA+ superfamily ATPase